MTIYKLYYEASVLANSYFQLTHFLTRPLNRKQQIRSDLLDDIILSIPRKKLSPEKSVLREPISQVKLSGNYPRKFVVQVFSKIGVKVTRYTREYGRTIVHFVDASDSAK